MNLINAIIILSLIKILSTLILATISIANIKHPAQRTAIWGSMKTEMWEVKPNTE